MKNILILLLLVLVSCGGNTPEPTPETFSIQITPGAALLTKTGETKALTAKVVNSSGNVVDKVITWTSSNPETVQISSDGVITALRDLGSSQIVASVGAAKSAPALVSLAEPAAGVVLLTDSQVRGDPKLVNPDAEADLDNPYEVLLSGISPPAPGTLLLGSEGIAVGGEVISSQIEGDAVRVQLKIVPIQTIMKTAQINEVLDYSNVKPTFPEEVLQQYDIKESNGEFVFTPKPSASTQATIKPRTLTPFQLGIFKCEYLTPELPISLSQPGQFSIKITPSLEIVYDRDTGLKRMLVKADLSFKTKIGAVLNAGGIINIGCEKNLYDKIVPLPGWVGLLLAGQLEAGVGFEIEGSAVVPFLGVEIASETKGTLEMGFECSDGNCKFVRKFDPTNTNEARFINPTNFVEGLKTEMFVFGYGFAKLKMGATFLEKLRLQVVTARLGVKLEAGLATPTTQITPSTNALDPDYQSSYKLNALFEIIVGTKNKGDTAFGKFFQKLGIFKLNILKFQVSKPISQSPKGTSTQDKSKFAAGDTVTFHVVIDPTTKDFAFIYNIENIVIMRRNASGKAEKVASINAQPNQLDFTIPWVADVASTNALGQKFYVFVDTKVPVPFDLELGEAIPLPSSEYTGVIRLEYNYSYAGSDPYEESSDGFCGDGTEVKCTTGGSSSGSSEITYILEGLYSYKTNESLTLNSVNKFFYLNKKDYQSYSKATLLNPEMYPNYGAPCTYPKTGSIKRTSLYASNEIDVARTRDIRLPLRITGDKFTAEDYHPQVYAKLEQSSSGYDKTNCGNGKVFGGDFPPKSSSVYQDLRLFDSFPGFEGIVTTDANNNKVIKGTYEYVTPQDPNQAATETQKWTTTIDLHTGNPAADLALSVTAPPGAAPSEKKTYAVNLQNKSNIPATNVQVEFNVPEGFKIIEAVGWNGCKTVFTTVTCSTATLAAQERRAFLIDVQIPDAAGVHFFTARVSARESDPDLTNNQDASITTVTELP
jgi:uncharacterized repeat protein (TIGR01451 family)